MELHQVLRLDTLPAPCCLPKWLFLPRMSLRLLHLHPHLQPLLSRRQAHLLVDLTPSHLQDRVHLQVVLEASARHLAAKVPLGLQNLLLLAPWALLRVSSQPRVVLRESQAAGHLSLQVRHLQLHQTLEAPPLLFLQVLLHLPHSARQALLDRARLPAR